MTSGELGVYQREVYRREVTLCGCQVYLYSQSTASAVKSAYDRLQRVSDISVEFQPLCKEGSAR